MFAVAYQGRFAGSVELRFDGIGGAEVGFGLAPWARGKGVMTRALRLVLAWGFGLPGIGVVYWRAQVGNWASRRVAGRCGFRWKGRSVVWNSAASGATPGSAHCGAVSR